MMHRTFVLALALAALPGTALAEDAGLYHAQSGALLSYADTEVKVLFAALNAKEFDIDITRALMDELKRALADAKKNVDRSTSVLEDDQQKLQPDFTKLREAVKAAEEAVERLRADVGEQVKAKSADDDPDAEKEGGEGGGATNWQLLKDGAGNIQAAISDAKTIHGKLAKGVKTPNLVAPPKAKAKK